MWRILIVAAVAGFALGVGRAWWDFGSFDATAPLAAFDYPADDEPDYWHPPTGRRAKAAFDALRYEFGKLEVGRTMRHRFRVTNEGDWPLVLAERESSCVCTAAELDGRPISPGESAEIMLEWSAPPRARPGEPYRQWTAIDTNDRERPTVTLVVEGELAAAVVAESPVLAFGTVAASGRRTLSTRVLSYRPVDAGAARGAESAVVRAEFDDPATAEAFEVRLERLAQQELADTEAAAGWRFSVTLKPGLPAGPFHQTIRLRTDTAGGADVGRTSSPPYRPPSERAGDEVAVSLAGEIGPDVYLIGPGYSRRTNTLALGRVGARKGAERRLALVAFAPSDMPIEPRVVETSPEGLAVEIGPPAVGEDGSTRWPVMVRVPPFDGAAAERTPTAGRIVIETGHTEVKRIEIAVTLAVAPAANEDRELAE